mmetsp:Transcript_63482/g.160655  ORF Transcript_63482/g.160655 Transcript_63482/m.160655 type:complete len:103 (+) Transcript_63482:162-470(+)
MVDTRTCAIHGKSRASRYLEQDAAGRYICMNGYECKAAGSGAGNDLRVQCTLHGKLRSLDCLEDDGTGRLVCGPDRRCKTAGQPMADGDRDRGGGGGGGDNG